MDNTELRDVIAQASRYLKSVDYHLTRSAPDLDAAYDLADKLLSQVGLARIVEAGIIRHRIAQGANHGK